MNKLKKKKSAWKRVLSVMLSVALMLPALPVSQAQAEDLKYGGVYYEVIENEEIGDYIKFWGMAEDYADYIVNDTYTFPNEIDGLPVKDMGTMSYKVNGAKKVVLPRNIGKWNSVSGDSIEEFWSMYTGYAPDIGNVGPKTFIDANAVPTLKDVYVYCSDFDSEKYWSTFLLGTDNGWEKRTELLTLHLASNEVAEIAKEDYSKFMTGGRKVFSDGSPKLEIVVDLTYSKYDDLTQLIAEVGDYQAEDYTKASWDSLQAVVTEAKALTEESENEAVEAAYNKLNSAIEALVSLTELQAALQEAGEQDIDLYTTASWEVLQQAVASAQDIPEDISKERLAEITKAIKDAIAGLADLAENTLTITCDSVQAPAAPAPKVTQNVSGGAVTFEYYSNKNCTSASGLAVPRTSGTWYVRAKSARTADYAAAYSNVVEFTITAAPEQGDGYSFDRDTGELTISDVSLIEKSETQGDVPWYEFMFYIKSVKLEGNGTLTKVGAYAFYDAMNMETFSLPDTVKEVGAYAFWRCTSWGDSIALTDATVGEYAFYSCKGIEGTVTLADTMEEVPDRCFYRCVKLNDGAEGYRIPAQAARIGIESFREVPICTYQLPDSLETIGEGAFRASGLKTIFIPENVRKIGKNAFTNCSNLEYVDFENPEYTEENLEFSQDRDYNYASGAAGWVTYDETFHGTSASLAVLCEGSTYETLAGHAGSRAVTLENYETHEYYDTTVGWPASALKKSAEYIGGIKDEVSTELAAAGKLEESDYPAAVWESLQSALAEAESLLQQGDSNYEKRNNYMAAREAISTGLKSCLNSYYEKVKEMSESSEAEIDYDTGADSWYDLTDALEDAEKVLGKEDALPEALIEGITVLKDAVKNLDYTPIGAAKVALDTAIQAAKDRKESDYTPESWKVLQDAIAEVGTIRQTGTKEQIEAAAQKINAAAEALVLVNPSSGSDEGDDAGTSASPSQAPGGNTGASASPSPTPGGNTGASASPSQAPGSNDGTGTSPSQAPGTNQDSSSGSGSGVSPTKQPAGNGGNGTQNPTAPKIKKAVLKKVKSGKKKTLLVQWKKQSGVTGYQVQIATNKKFTKGKKTYTVNKAKTVKKTIKKLKSKKKYFVRVRAYQTVKGKKYTGSWSKAKSVKVK